MSSGHTSPDLTFGLLIISYAFRVWSVDISADLGLDGQGFVRLHRY